MSIEEAYRQVRRTGCVYGTPEEVKAQLADISVYLGTKDPIELGAALLLEQAGYERTQVQLQLDLAGNPTPARSLERSQTESVAVRCDNEGRRDHAAQAIALYDDGEPIRGDGPSRVANRESGEEALAELLCGLRHFADELGFKWPRVLERADRYYAEESGRHVVEVTAEGFQILDTETQSLRADVWASHREAAIACADLNERQPQASAPPEAAGGLRKAP